MTAGGSGLRSGQVAAAAGVNVETLRYYERRGLLARPHRSPGGHRLYPAETVTLLRIMKAAQRLGFTLEEIAGLLELGRHHHRPRGEAAESALQQQARVKLAEVEERIADLTTIRDTLRAALDAGCTDLVECADSDGCPIPFEPLSSRSGRADRDRERSAG
jgi:DNA-binding transcriptional MerR regulator